MLDDRDDRDSNYSRRKPSNHRDLDRDQGHNRVNDRGGNNRGFVSSRDFQSSDDDDDATMMVISIISTTEKIKKDY